MKAGPWSELPVRLLTEQGFRIIPVSDGNDIMTVGIAGGIRKGIDAGSPYKAGELFSLCRFCKTAFHRNRKGRVGAEPDAEGTCLQVMHNKCRDRPALSH